MKKKILLFLIAVSLLAPAALMAAAGENAATKHESLHAIPPILDPEFRHRKKNQFELTGYGGSYLGDSVGQSFIAGAKSRFHFNNTVSAGVAYGYSNINADDSSNFGSNIIDDNMNIWTAEVDFSNDTAFRAFKTLVEMDFYLTLGAGATEINKTWEPTGLLGGGVKFYPGLSFLAFRVEVLNYIHYSNDPFGHSLDFDIAFVGGVSVLFPSRPSPYEKR